MIHPVLTILIASSVHLSAESPRASDFAQIVLEVTQAVETAAPLRAFGEPEATVCDVPFYYSDFTPLRAPQAVLRITYDWRSPVIFDLP